MRRPTPPIGAIVGHDRAQIELLDRVQHKPHQVIGRNQSRRLGGNNSTCSRSHAMKFCAIPQDA